MTYNLVNLQPILTTMWLLSWLPWVALAYVVFLYSPLNRR